MSRLIRGMLIAVLAVAGCDQGEFAGEVQLPEQIGPGLPAWASENVSCRVDADCADLETCVEGTCRLKGCTANLRQTSAPLGTERYLQTRRELLVGNGSNLYGLKQNGTSVSNVSTWMISGLTSDVAGGNLLGSRPETAAVASVGSKSLTIIGAAQRSTVPLTFVPQAIDAGDTDGDGRDEVVAFGASGQVAVCDVEKLTCQGANFVRTGWKALDVAVADLDGDGLAEAAFLAEIDGKRKIAIWNVQSEGEAVVRVLDPKEPGAVPEMERLSAGDLDGNGFAELVAVHYDSWSADHLYVFSLTGDALPLAWDKQVDTSVQDVAVDDRDGDGRSEIYVLTYLDTAWTYKTAAGLDKIALETKTNLGSTGATRLSLLDANGDSPLGRLFEGPKLVDGQLVPIAVLTFPPFSRSFSDGEAGVSLGAYDSSGGDETTSIYVSHGVNIGYDFGVAGLFDVSLGAGASYNWGRDLTKGNSLTIGTSYSFGSRVEIYGSEYAGVVVESGCFAAYTYEVEDPEATIGPDANRAKFTMLMPVGGQATLWSSARYNAMAKAMGGLPPIKVPFQIGAPRSYPREMITLEGTPVKPEDLVFQNPPTWRVSDVGEVSWSLTAGTSVTNSVSKSIDFTGSLGVAFWKMNVGYSYTRGWGTSESVFVGRDVELSGWVPSIPDNPETPEDEYDVNSFAFTPYVYRQSYTDGADRQGGYYVLTYMVRE